VSLNSNAQTPTSVNIYANNYNIFDPGEVTISVNDTVYFENLGMHNAVEVSEETYNNNGITSNGGFAYYSDNYHVFTEPGTYYYVCTPHIQYEMKGIINVEQDINLIGQWYATELGDYINITEDSFIIYIFDSEDCYEIENNTYEIENNTLTIEGEDQETIEITILNASSESFTVVLEDTITVNSTSFDPSEWVECDEQEFDNLCDSIELVEVMIDTNAVEITFSIYNMSTSNINYPFVNSTFDANDNMIQQGYLDLFVSMASDTTNYSYPLSNNGSDIVFPLTINFTYSDNLALEEETCQLSYDLFMTGLDNFSNNDKKNLIQILDIFGRKTNIQKNKTLLYIFDDGSVERKFILE
jgi:plastocyanin